MTITNNKNFSQWKKWNGKSSSTTITASPALSTLTCTLTSWCDKPGNFEFSSKITNRENAFTDPKTQMNETPQPCQITSVAQKWFKIILLSMIHTQFLYNYWFLQFPTLWLCSIAKNCWFFIFPALFFILLNLLFYSVIWITFPAFRRDRVERMSKPQNGPLHKVIMVGHGGVGKSALKRLEMITSDICICLRILLQTN